MAHPVDLDYVVPEALLAHQVHLALEDQDLAILLQAMDLPVPKVDRSAMVQMVDVLGPLQDHLEVSEAARRMPRTF